MVHIKINEITIENIELVIFDKDGTLMDLYHYWSNMIALRVGLAQKILGFDSQKHKDIMFAMGVDLAKERLRSEGPVGLKKREIVMKAMVDALNAMGFNNSHEMCFGVFEEADKLSIDRLEEIIRPINGMDTLVNDLYKNKCKIAIATTDKTERAKLAVKVLGISGMMDIVVGEDMVKNCKPHPDMALLILERLQIKKENAVMVGDAETDVVMGSDAGLQASIGVTSGLTEEQTLLQFTPHVIPDISFIKIL